MSFLTSPVRYFQKSEKLRLGYVVLGQQFQGSRRPLVFICGMGGTFVDFESLAREMAKSRCVLLYDHRGMGFSSYGPSITDFDITMPNLAQDMLDLVVYLGWREVDLLGWSMGGVVIQQLLIDNKYGGKVKIPHAVFGATSAKLPDGEPGALMSMGAMFGASHAFTGDRASQDFRESLRPTVELYFDAALVAEKPEQIEKAIDLVALGTRRAEIIGAQAMAGVGMDFRPLTHQFPSSTRLLIIHGTKDRIVFPHESDPFIGLPQAERIAVGSKVGEIPHFDFGHSWWEYFTPKTWTDAIGKFLDS